MTLLREGLLHDRRIALSGSVSDQLQAMLADLGASTDPPADALLHNASGTFATDGLIVALQETWSAIAEAAKSSLIPRGEGGKVVLIAPRPQASAHAGAARDALENLARTLSIEWARYGITTTAIAPGQDTREEDVATLACFLLSRAGDYYSGARFDLV